MDEATDLRTDPRTEEWRERLGRPPEREEIINEMKKMKDGAPGEDGARISYILKGGGKVLEEIVELVKYMWENGADKWETSLKRGIIIPLFKKGNSPRCPTLKGSIALFCCKHRYLSLPFPFSEAPSLPMPRHAVGTSYCTVQPYRSLSRIPIFALNNNLSKDARNP